jgi:hypothetical protein
VWPCAPLADSRVNIGRSSDIDDQKSDISTISDSDDGTNDGGKLDRSAVSCTTAFPILSSTLRLPVGRISPGMPTRSPACTSTSASANAMTSARLSLDSLASGEVKCIEGERSAQIHTVCAASHSCSRT